MVTLDHQRKSPNQSCHTTEAKRPLFLIESLEIISTTADPLIEASAYGSSFRKTIVIRTDRLVLRPFEESDIEQLKGVWGDRETMLFYPEPFSDAQIKEIVFEQIRVFEECGYSLFAVLERETNSFVGDCGITIQDIDGVQEFEIGYRIKRGLWGLGYATEAALAVKEYGFETLQLKRLCCYMESAHKQSRRVAEKIGMKLEKEYLNPNNRNLLTTVYSATNANQALHPTSDSVPRHPPRVN